MDWVRGKLAEKGRVWLTEHDPDDLSYKGDCWSPSNLVECSFKREEMSLSELCHQVAVLIDDKIAPDRHEMEIDEVPLHPYLKRDYGVRGEISSRRFVKSIFLGIAKLGCAKLDRNSAEGSPQKKVRQAHNDEVIVGMVETHINGVKDDRHNRFRKIYRFYSASNEPMEICLESRSSFF